MLTFAIVVFVLAAIGGLVLASRVLRGKFAPWPVSVIHALAGATGLVLLLFALFSNQNESRLLTALVVLVVAALGGFFLASFHLRKRLAPKAIVVVHAGVAATGLILLLTTLPGVTA